MEGQKRTQVGLGNPDDSADSVHNESAGLDPPADGTARDVEMFRDLSDREEVDLTLAVTPTRDMAET